MSAERTMVANRLALLRLPVTQLVRTTPVLRPAICARRVTLDSASCGRLTYYTNTSDNPYVRERPLLLLHGIHDSASAYDVRLLFEAMRAERAVYALDLPGFGSSERGDKTYSPELYVGAIGELLTVIAQSGAQEVDILAMGLTCEYAAMAAVREPTRVHSLTFISPTGFAVKREQASLEKAARDGKRRRSLQLLAALGVSPLLYRALVSQRLLRRNITRFVKAGARLNGELFDYLYATTHQPGAQHAVLAYRCGSLYPAGNPQSIYTRVHCPTLILYAEQCNQGGYGSLATFVKWREHIRAVQIDDASLLHEESAQQVSACVHEFLQKVREQELAEQDVRWQRGDLSNPDVAFQSSY